MKILTATLLGAAALWVAACSSSSTSVPRDQTNVCNILEDREDWGEALAETQHKWGAPPHVVMAIIWKESSFRHDAKTPKKYTFFGLIPNGRVSSAYGYSQALDGTWDEYKREQGGFGRRRDDITDATDFMGWYMKKSEEDLGISLADARNQYLASHEGRTGFKRGSYRRKSWLLRVSKEVASRAVLYDTQLRTCGML